MPNLPPTLITPDEVNTIAFTVPISSSLILPSIISSAEHKFLIPVVTQAVYDDMFVNGSFYASLLSNFVKPYLAFCAKLLLYNQYITESSIPAITPAITAPLAPLRLDVLRDLSAIITAKRQILEVHLSSDLYPLYEPPVKNRMSGFLITE